MQQLAAASSAHYSAPGWFTRNTASTAPIAGLTRPVSVCGAPGSSRAGAAPAASPTSTPVNL